MAAVVLVFAGTYSLFTYIKPYSDHLPGIPRGGLAMVLFLYSFANLAGVTVAGRPLSANPFRILVGPPLAMSLMAFALIALTATLLAACGVVA